MRSRRRSALELVGGNGYTSDYPVARWLRDAQVLTVWEGPANIQALELLRMLAPRYQGWQDYRDRVHGVIDRLPVALDHLRTALAQRLKDDVAAVEVTLRDERSAQRFARKLLHRLSRSLALALLCERADEGHKKGNLLPAHSAWRFLEEIQSPLFAAENEAARRGVLEALNEELHTSAKLT